MNQLVCVGSNHELCPIEVREKIAFPNPKLASAMEAMKSISSLREWFLLSTCNRVELYGFGAPGIGEDLVRFLSGYHSIPQECFSQYLYRFDGPEAAKHLFRVASGLDSMVVGENEIFDQVRSVFELAQELKTIGPAITPLLEKTLEVGKRVRRETKISDGAVSVGSIAVMLAEKIFKRLSDKKIMILGTGAMSHHTIRNLLKAGARSITVINRTYERALELAEKHAICAAAFNEWPDVFLTSDMVISSTAAAQPIIQYETVHSIMMNRKDKPLFLIDIAVPRDIEPDVAQIPGVHLFDIDDLKSIAEKNLERRKKEVFACEMIIEEELQRVNDWFLFARQDKQSLRGRVLSDAEAISKPEIASVRSQ